MTNLKDPTLDRYLNGDYATKNPEWDRSDASWKAEKLTELLFANEISPSSIVEVGCGSGAILEALAEYFPDASLAGFDIAPGASQFWKEASKKGIKFKLADYCLLNEPVPDLLLLMDVLEHIGNPWEFLESIKDRSKLLAIHFPLDLSASSVLREYPLLKVRDKVGHLHFFTRGLALSLLEETGFDIIEARYTGAALNAPQRSFKTKCFSLIRRVVYFFNKDIGARALGGETLMVLAKPRAKNWD